LKLNANKAHGKRKMENEKRLQEESVLKIINKSAAERGKQ